ncbi:hypothetical protein GCM10012280_68960 [Wenjunlia tyrosinilytica]|uniref:Uncharacterized protein n=1 Tax=Wenjunlia tyrosinilytica TaxID=1544741 RepID=A0A917ZYF3_9ACTN|nr:hypothetical protein GCM10012280_68960 [Wenjunlia tyrosinilytica]
MVTVVVLVGTAVAVALVAPGGAVVLVLPSVVTVLHPIAKASISRDAAGIGHRIGTRLQRRREGSTTLFQPALPSRPPHLGESRSRNEPITPADYSSIPASAPCVHRRADV